MMRAVRCACGKKVGVVGIGGKWVRCPHCNGALRVPGSTGRKPATTANESLAARLLNAKATGGSDVLRGPVSNSLFWVMLALGICGMGATMVGVWSSTRQSCWVKLHKSAKGELSSIGIYPDRVPKDIWDQLPEVDDGARMTSAEIESAGRRFHLFDVRKCNPQLQWSDVTVAYWSQQKRPKWEVVVEMLAHKVVLDAADCDGVFIPDQGALSYWAERVYVVLAKKARSKHNGNRGK